MPRGRKKNYKGKSRQFTNEDSEQARKDREQRDLDWRRQKGMLDSDEEAEEKKKDVDKDSKAAAANRDLPESESSSEESSDEEEKEAKAKGIQHLIEVENPNRARPRDVTKKVSTLEQPGPAAEGGEEKEGATGNLSRREREEVEKTQAKAHYMKMHLEGKTDEARADMARLALIRKQREETAKKREDEKKVKDEAKSAAEQRLLEKKKKAQKK